jgi:hypothetical protein
MAILIVIQITKRKRRGSLAIKITILIKITDCYLGARALAFLLPQVLLPCRFCAGWLCTQVRWNPEVTTIITRRLATAGLKLSEAMITRIQITQRRTRGRFAPIQALWGASSLYRPVPAMAVRKCSECCELFRVFRGRALFVRGNDSSIF